MKELLHRIIKQYCVKLNSRLEEIKNEVENDIEEVFKNEKKLSKVYNKCLDEISELEEYMEARQEQLKEERRNAAFYPVLQLKTDRNGEFFADITFDNRNRLPKKKRPVIKEKEKKKSHTKKDENIDLRE